MPTPDPSPLRQAQDEREGSIRIAGYAALFGIADGAADTILRGAFARTLAARREPFPLYWQHRAAQRIGTVESLAEDERGLRVIARIDKADSLAAALLRRREVSGLSFGYRARGYRRTAGGRVLEDIDLIEVSLVTHPLQHGARVHLVESSPACGGGGERSEAGGGLFAMARHWPPPSAARIPPP